MSNPSIKLNGRSYVVVPREEYDTLKTLAKSVEWPPLPEPDERGYMPAAEFARASLARGIIRDRVKLGLSQKELARRAGIRVETLCRIETGKHSPSIASIDKLDRALKAAEAEKQPAATSSQRSSTKRTRNNKKSKSRRGQQK